MHAVVEISGALATMFPVATFADTVTDTIAGGLGGGAVGSGEDVCNLGGFVVWDDQGLGWKSTL